MQVLLHSQDFVAINSLKRLLEQNEIVVVLDIDESRKYPGIFGGPITYRLCILADEQLADAQALLNDPQHEVLVPKSHLKVLGEDLATMSFFDRLIARMIKSISNL
jgi:Putative prokaryotic signal transducing protein